MTEQRTMEWVKEMSKLKGYGADQIEAARKSGALNDVLGIVAHAPADEQWTVDDVKRLAKEGRHHEIEKARQTGKLNTILGIEA